MRKWTLAGLLFAFTVSNVAVALAATGSQLAWDVVGQIGGPTQAVAVQGNYAYVGVGPRLLVLDVSNPAGMREMGATAPFPHFVEKVVVSGTLAYVAAGAAGLRVVDISNPAHPTEIGAWDSPGYAEGVAVAGSTVYLADGPYGLWVVDVSNPAQPRQVGSVYDMNYAFDVVVDAHYVYIAAAGAGLLIADVLDPAHPIAVGKLDTPGYAYGVAVSGNIVYVADGWEGLRAVNVTDPAHPAQIGSYKTLGWASNVALSGSLAFVADAFGGLRILQVLDPTHPTELAGFETKRGDAATVAIMGNTAYVADRRWGLLAVNVADPALPAQAGLYGPLTHGDTVAVAGNYAYVAAGYSGLRVIDVHDPAQPRQIGTYDTGSTYATGIAVDGSRVYVVAILGPKYGLHILDVSDPSHPKRLAFFQVLGEQFQDVIVIANTVYLGGEHTLFIVDVSDPTSPALRSSLQLTTEFGAFDVPMAISGSRLYVALYGLKIVDISNPSAPAVIGGYTPTNGMYVADIATRDNKVYLVGRSPTLRIVDVSDASHVAELGSYDSSAIQATGISVSGTIAYVADGTGLQAIDISNSSAPRLIASYHTPGYAHSVALTGDMIFVADEIGGLSILTQNSGPGTTERTMIAQQEVTDSRVENQSDAYMMTLVPPVISPIMQTSQPASGVTCIVTSTMDTGPGTLRDCLEQAQAGNTIAFDTTTFPPASPTTITLQTPLPALTQGRLTIDGSNAGVILDGHNTPARTSGLVIRSDDNVIRGLQIVLFPEAGIYIWGKGNTVGGDKRQGSGPMGQGNLSSGNQFGVNIDGQDATKNTVIGNFIGTTANGRSALGNSTDGVFIAGGAYGNLIKDNVISGNGRFGVVMTDWGNSYNVIIGNLIGTDAAGKAMLGNGMGGVGSGSGAGRNRIGGTSPDERNVISGGGGGISIGTGTGTLILGNFIGTDIGGATTVSNTDSGISVYGKARHTFVGGATAGESNLVGGSSVGVHVSSDFNMITNNLIGTDASGAAAVGNRREGVQVYAGTANTIQGNTIAFNSAVGVNVIANPHNTIRRNSIYGNAGMAIQNGTSGQDRVAPPIITGAGARRIVGIACPGCTVEIFSDKEDEAQFYEGSTVADPASGAFVFTKSLIFVGPKVTTTATDGTGTTSELSATQAVPSRFPGDVNEDGAITMADAILALKILVGINTAEQTLIRYADVNGDGKIGLPETIYILQKAAGIR